MKSSKFFARFLAVMLAVAMVFGNVVIADAEGQKPPMNFSDVPENHPYYEDIKWAYEKGLISGYADGTFKPDQTAKKVEFAAVCCKLWGQDDFIRVYMAKNKERFKRLYVDVKENSWMFTPALFYFSISQGSAEKVEINDDAKTCSRYFEPNSPLLRWKIAAYLGDSSFFIGRGSTWEPKKKLNREKWLSKDIYYTTQYEDYLAERTYSFDVEFESESVDRQYLKFLVFTGVMKLLSAEALSLDDEGNFGLNNEVTRGEMLRSLKKIDDAFQGANPLGYFLDKKGR